MKLKKKIFIILIFISLVPLITISVVLNKKVINNYDLIVDEKIDQAINVSEFFLESTKKEVLLIAKNYAENWELISALKNQNRELLSTKIKSIYSMLNKENGITVFEFGDSRGNVFLRGHNLSKFGDDKSDNKSIKMALQGEEVTGFEFGKSGLAVRAFVPIREGNNILGTLQVGVNLTDKFLGNINKLILGGMAFYEEDRLIQTSNLEERKQIGEVLENPSIYKKVSQGQNVQLFNKEGNIELYSPLYNPTGDEVQGIIRITEELNMQKEALTFTIFIVSITIVCVAIISFLISRGIVNPILLAVNFAEEIAQGNLGAEKLEVNAKDEVGILGDSLNKMLDNLRNIMMQVANISHDLVAASEELSASGEQVGITAEKVGTAVQNVAAGAEEQSAQIDETVDIVDLTVKQIDEVNNNSEELANSIAIVADKINKGNESASRSIDQVNRVKEVSIDVANNINSLGKLSKEIGQIVDLISNISQQTNLLALNAAIEAARAGEFGRGFSVVADEIRELAEESSNATNNITDLINKITSGIADAVTKMNESVETVEVGVNSIKEKNEVFSEINSMVLRLNNVLNKVNTNMELMLSQSNKVQKTVYEIASVSQEFAGNSEDVAASSEEQIASTEEIVSGAKRLALMAEELSEAVNKFTL